MLDVFASENGVFTTCSKKLQFQIQFYRFKNFLEKLDLHSTCTRLTLLPDYLRIKFCTAGNYMFKVNNRNTKTRCEICSKLTIKIPERSQLHFVLPFTLCSSVSIVNFEHVIDGWVGLYKLTSYDLEILVQLPKIPWQRCFLVCIDNSEDTFVQSEQWAQ